MTDNQAQWYAAGRAEKGDLLVELQPAKSGGWQLTVDSSVGALFGDQIRRTVEDGLKAAGFEHARVKIKDLGAVDFIIRARVEAAAVLAGAAAPPLILAKTAGQPSARDRLRRTRLYLPGNNPDLMINAGLFGADCLILDLEDSVAPAEKFAARFLVRRALQLDFQDAERIVRINPISTPYGEEDLKWIVPAAPNTLLIPKCESAEDVTRVEKVVAALEKKAGLKQPSFFMPLIESAKGCWNALAIASASPRNVALCFGAEDFTADIGAERTVEGRESFVARSLIVMAARAAGIQAIDTVFSDVGDPDGLVASTREALAMGFDGKGVIHPMQIKPIHQVFCPTAEQIDRAKKVMQALEDARVKGSGVASLGSKMIDAPVAARAARVLARARAYGLLD